MSFCRRSRFFEENSGLLQLQLISRFEVQSEVI